MKMISFLRLVCVVIAVAMTTVPAHRVKTKCNADTIKNAINGCHSLVGATQTKCDDQSCHRALHFLTSNDTIKCYQELQMGDIVDLVKYKTLDDFCDGEGSDHGGQHDHEHHDHDHDHHDHDDHGTSSGAADDFSAMSISIAAFVATVVAVAGR